MADNADAIDETLDFRPRFDAAGLITAICQSVDDGAILMVAYMNDTSLQMTRDTGFAHFWSRSRQSLWKKGETSGNMLKVRDILVDCDQDCLLIQVEPAGPACHTGRKTCFYRRIKDDGLALVES